MTDTEIISGLKMTADFVLLDPMSGEYKTREDLNDLDRITYDACMDAISILRNLTDSIKTEREQSYYRGYEDGIQKGRESVENKGEWEKIWRTDCGRSEYVCSKCGCGEDYKTDFCPNCGADMRGDKAE